MEECDAVELARRFGTPVYVVSEDQLRRNARRIAAAFADRWPEGAGHAAPVAQGQPVAGAPPHPELGGAGLRHVRAGRAPRRARLRDRPGARLGERHGQGRGARPARGRGRGAGHARQPRRARPRLGGRARRRPHARRCGFRLRPDYDGLDMPSDFDASVSIREGAHRYKPGIPLEQAADVARKALADDGIELAGVMAHLGRHSADPEVWRAMAGSFAAAIGRLSAELDGWRPGRDRRRRRLRGAARPHRPRRPRRRRSRTSPRRSRAACATASPPPGSTPPGSGSRPSRAARSTPTAASTSPPSET